MKTIKLLKRIFNERKSSRDIYLEKIPMISRLNIK